MAHFRPSPLLYILCRWLSCPAVSWSRETPPRHSTSLELMCCSTLHPLGHLRASSLSRQNLGRWARPSSWGGGCSGRRPNLQRPCNIAEPSLCLPLLRYAIHWHLQRNLNYLQYIRGCAIHHSYNRATTIHGTHAAILQVGPPCQYHLDL